MKIPQECIESHRKCLDCEIFFCRKCEYPTGFMGIFCSDCLFLRQHPLARLKQNVLLNRLKRIGLSGLSLRELTYLYINQTINNFDRALRLKYKKDAFEKEIGILHDLFHFSFEP